MSLPLIISFHILIELPFAIAAATVATGDRTNLSITSPHVVDVFSVFPFVYI